MSWSNRDELRRKVQQVRSNLDRAEEHLGTMIAVFTEAEELWEGTDYSEHKEMCAGVAIIIEQARQAMAIVDSRI